MGIFVLFTLFFSAHAWSAEPFSEDVRKRLLELGYSERMAYRWTIDSHLSPAFVWDLKREMEKSPNMPPWKSKFRARVLYRGIGDFPSVYSPENWKRKINSYDGSRVIYTSKISSASKHYAAVTPEWRRAVAKESEHAFRGIFLKLSVPASMASYVDEYGTVTLSSTLQEDIYIEKLASWRTKYQGSRFARLYWFDFDDIYKKGAGVSELKMLALVETKTAKTERLGHAFRRCSSDMLWLIRTAFGPLMP